MIEILDSKDQTKYHGKRFDKTKLPSLSDAGFLSASTISKFKDPLKHMSLEDPHATADMAWGSLVDLLWLTPEDWDDHVAMIPKDAPKRATAAQINAPKPTALALERIDWWKAFDKKNLGKMYLTISEKEKVQVAVDMLNAHPTASYIYDNSMKQVILEGESRKLHPSGINLKAKAMMDLLPVDGTIMVGQKEVKLNTCVVDLKQTNDCGLFGMKKAMRTFEYPLKTKWYLNMLQASGDTERVNSILIFQNSKPPHDVHVIKIDDADMDAADYTIAERITQMQNVNPEDLSNLYDTDIPEVTTRFN